MDFARSRLIVLSPWADPEGPQPLAPVIFYGEGVPSGFATSASTQQRGLVLSRDILPSVLEYLGVPVPDSLLGQPVRFEASARPERPTLLAFEAEQAGAVLRGRVPAAVSFSLACGLALAAALLAAYGPLSLRDSEARRHALRALMFVPLALALFFTISPGFFPWGGTTAARVALPVVLALVGSGLAMRKASAGRSVVLLTASVTFVALAGDQVSGGYLARNYLLDYSPITDGRFYGMGNELMSFFVATGLVLFGLAVPGGNALSARFWVVAAASGVLATFVVGMPFWGANFGGALTAACAFWAMWLLLRRSHLGLRGALFVAAMMSLTLGVCVAADVVRPPSEQTHLARFALSLAKEGLPALWATILRKSAANLRVLMFLRWAVLFVLLLPAAVYCVLKPIKALQRVLGGPAAPVAVGAMLKAAVYSGLVGMIFNDSGIVIPCIMLGVVVPIAFLLSRPNGDARGETVGEEFEAT